VPTAAPSNLDLFKQSLLERTEVDLRRRQLRPLSSVVDVPVSAVSRLRDGLRGEGLDAAA